ncbi:hypothetical protein AAC03nite_20120 [Alicyclobacillus acidoterrestris]|nr:hypothetical protein AAC03nite_20120 [Alicyclobacillus acidoterrestris]
MELTPEESAQIRANEPDLLQGLFAAGDDAQQTTAKISIQRNGKFFFSFNIHALSEKDYKDASDQATRFTKNKQLGIKVPEERNDAEYRSLLIYKATVDADRAALWDAAKARYGVLTGADVIDKVLLPGEKAAILQKIDEVSGYGTDLDDAETKLEETAKNS